MGFAKNAVFSGHELSCLERMHWQNYQRRSGRVSRSVPVRIHWTAPDGTPRSAEAVTLVLSRYGCAIRCATRERVPADLILEDQDRAVEAPASVVYREIGNAGAFVLALEFSSSNNFWGFEFPARPAAGDGGR